MKSFNLEMQKPSHEWGDGSKEADDRVRATETPEGTERDRVE